VVICLEQGAYGLADATAAPSPLASLKSRLIYSFWSQLIKDVLEKRLLNGCLHRAFMSRYVDGVGSTSEENSNDRMCSNLCQSGSGLPVTSDIVTHLVW